MSKTYQWIKGDDAGKVVKWDGDIEQIDGVGNFLIFQDGSRANENLMGDFFMEIADENDLILMPEPKGGVPQGIPQIIQSSQSLQIQAPGIIEKTVSPMHRLLSESKKNKTTVNVGIVADMPPIELMRVLADSYDDGETQVLEYIASTINTEDVKAQIAKQIWLSAFTPKAIRTRNTKKINETA